MKFFLWHGVGNSQFVPQQFKMISILPNVHGCTGKPDVVVILANLDSHCNCVLPYIGDPWMCIDLFLSSWLTNSTCHQPESTNPSLTLVCQTRPRSVQENAQIPRNTRCPPSRSRPFPHWCRSQRYHHLHQTTRSFSTVPDLPLVTFTRAVSRSGIWTLPAPNMHINTESAFSWTTRLLPEMY